METESKNKVNEGDLPKVNRDAKVKGAKMSTTPNQSATPQEKQPIDPRDKSDDVILLDSCEFVDLTCDSPEPDQSFDMSCPSPLPSSREVEFGINRLQKEFLPPWELRKLNAEQKQTLSEKYLKLNKSQRSELTHSQRSALNRMLFETDIPFPQLGKEQKRAQRIGMEKVMSSDQQTKYVMLLSGGLPHQEALCEILGQTYVQAIELIDLLLNDSTDIKSKPLDWDKNFLINVTRNLFPSRSAYSRWTHEQKKSLAIKCGQLRKDQQVFLSKNQRQKMVKMLEQVDRAGIKPVPAAKVPEQSFKNKAESKTGIQQNASRPWVPVNQPEDHFWPGCMAKAEQDMFGWAQGNLPSMNNQFQSPFGLPLVQSNNPFESHQMNPFGLHPVAPDPSLVKRQSSYYEEPVTSKRSRFTEESDQYVVPGMYPYKAPSPPQFHMKQSSSREPVKPDKPPSAERSESFNLCIVPSKYPYEILTEKEMDIIENSILETVLEIGDGAMPPTFNGSFRHKGRYQVICVDEFSKEWLFKFLRTHPLWPNASLKIVATEATEIRVRASLPPCNDDDVKILRFISAQNKGLNVDVWRIVERTDSNTSTSLTVVVDVESANVLRRCEKINFKMGKAEISIVDDQISERQPTERGFQEEIQRVLSPHGSAYSRGSSSFHQERVSKKTVNQSPLRHASRGRSDARQRRGSELPGCIHPREHPNRDQFGYHQERVSELPGRDLLREHPNRDQLGYHQAGGFEVTGGCRFGEQPSQELSPFNQEIGSELTGRSQLRKHSNRDQPGYHLERGSELTGRSQLTEHFNRDQPGCHQERRSELPGRVLLRGQPGYLQERGFEVPGHSGFREQPSQEPSPFDQGRVSDRLGLGRPKEHSRLKDRSGSGAPDVRPSPWITDPFKSGPTEEHGRFQDPVDRRSKNPSFSDPWDRSLHAPDVEPRRRSRWDTADSSKSDRPGQIASSMFLPDRIPECPSHTSRSRPLERTPMPSSHPRESSPIRRRRREFSRQ